MAHESTKITRRAFQTSMAALPAAAGAAQQSGNARGPIRIVTTYQFEPFEIEKIKKAVSSSEVEIVICKSREDFRRNLRDADVVYGSFNGPDLDYAPRLKWVQSGAAGMEWMDDQLRQSPIVLTNYARIFAPGISETAMGLLLCLTRGLSKYYIPQFAQRQMKPVGTVKSDHHTELVGRTMAIVGMGGIGSALSRRAYYGFDMKIVATDAKPIPKPEYVSELHDPGWFPKMVPMADVLVAAAPSTPLTRRMFNEQVFRSMKKTAYFLAMSRGDLYDDLALARALKEGWIAGAGLDVTPQEPLPADHPLFDCPNVVMSAHTSGWSPDRQVRLIDFFAENVRRYSEGIPLVNVVDKPKGY
jgi:phosphoglycerate dehydrogenase-like enzyme